MKDILFTDYMVYRAAQRNYSLENVEKILRFSPERYTDVYTGRRVAVGSDRRQIRALLRTGRFTYE